ncbi:MAG: hypothetical protein ABSF67_18260 [Roseiarcus sp.]|jgi:hypothetical protein
MTEAVASRPAAEPHRLGEDGLAEVVGMAVLRRDRTNARRLSKE